jgi:hypothetical protein
MTPELFFTGSKLQTHVLTCQYSGSYLGKLELITVAGHVPYMTHWKQTQTLHPLFSLEPGALLKFAHNAWTNFCSLTPEQAADAALTAKQEKLLQITALALLHAMADVKQDTPWLPTIQEVSGCWTSLMQLSYWKNYLESHRFKFPGLRISKRYGQDTPAVELQPFLQVCWQVKKDYETKVKEAVELEKLKSAELALVAIRNDLVTKAPKSKKLLWRWFLAHIPPRYSRDTEGWMWDLFDAETEEEIIQFTLADIDLFEEIVLCELPLGTSISHAFLERLTYKRKLLQTRFSTFEILIPEAVQQEKDSGGISEIEPQLKDFPSKVKWIVAHSKWKLAHTNLSKNRDAAINKQATVTVSPSYVPDITPFIGTGDSITELSGLLNLNTPNTDDDEENLYDN